ncbi:MAG TPA: toll/interleukin-1 receptor domain-containing protein [Pyrinomonadaceae bacterium]|jgi:hypothetical protein|nr:toll/interleukin-1 receptor domain-containing protein [Pyrinomonadaceae bacterium]
MPRFDYFISHHQADSGVEASLLAEALRNQGYRVFLDVDTHSAGDVNRITKDALKASRAFVVLIGPTFAERVQNDRDWVTMELLLAHQLEKKIVPILTADSDESLSKLPSKLQFLKSLRRIRFDRARVYAITDELREAFGFRQRTLQGPGLMFQIVMIVLALSLGLTLYRSVQLSAELSAEQQRRDAAERRETGLKERIDLLDRENRELLREAAQINKALERNRSSTR